VEREGKEARSRRMPKELVERLKTGEKRRRARQQDEDDFKKIKRKRLHGGEISGERRERSLKEEQEIGHDTTDKSGSPKKKVGPSDEKLETQERVGCRR